MAVIHREKVKDGTEMKISIITEIDSDSVIAEIDESATFGHPIIFDETWNKPFKDRLNIVVSQTKMGHQLFQEENGSQLVYFQPDLKSAIKFATWYCPDNDEIFVTGKNCETAVNENLVDGGIYVRRQKID